MKRKRHSHTTSFQYSTLEPKRLLAGDLGELNLLVNGDFSEVPVAEVRPNFFDSDSVAGWRAANSADGQQIVLFTFGDGEDANTFLKLDSTADQIDLVEQDVTTDADETYIITFDLRGQVVDGLLVSETVEVLWDGEVVGEFEGTDLLTTHAIIVEGSDTGVSTLGFREAADGDNAAGNGVGVLIDNVNVAVVEQSDGVTNGSFEDSTGDGPFFSNGNIPGWTALDRGGRPDLIQLQSNGDNPNVLATDGTEVLNLDTTGEVVDHVFADFATTEGASYFVTFDLFADGPQDVDPDEVRVRWKSADAEISTDQWIATVFGNNTWQSYGFLVEGLGDISRLELREPAGSPGDGSGALIDNVRLFLVEDAPVDTNPLALASIATQTVEAGSPLFVALDVTNPSNGELTYSAVSADESILTASFETGDSLRLNVTAPDVVTNGQSTPLSGELTFQLIEEVYGDAGSRATDRIRTLTNQGFYDGIEFHRIIDGFVIQGGDPTGTGTGGSDLGDFDDQFSTLLQHNQAGLLSYAKGPDDSNDSQFFITDDATRSLDFQHTIFGVQTSGDELRAAINDVDTGANPNNPFAGDYPIGTVTIESAEIFQDNQRAAVLLNVPEGASGETTLTVTVRDEAGNETTQEITVNVVAPTDQFSDSTPFLDDIPELDAQIGVETTFQLTAQDVEGDTLRFLDLEDIQDINDNLVFGTPISIPSFTETPLFNYDVENDSGLLSFTPLPGSPDTIEFLVGVVQADATVDNSNIDLQVVTVNITG